MNSRSFFKKQIFLFKCDNLVDATDQKSKEEGGGGLEYDEYFEADYADPASDRLPPEDLAAATATSSTTTTTPRPLLQSPQEEEDEDQEVEENELDIRVMMNKKKLSGATRENSTFPSNQDYFPETWLFDLVELDGEGEAFLDAEAPHSVTSWVAEAVCMHEEDGLGISEQKT